MQPPKRPVDGSEIPPGWFTNLYDFILSLVPAGDSKTITVNRDRNGSRFSVISPGKSGSGNTGNPAAGQTLYKAVVQFGTAQSGYTCELYDIATGESKGSGVVFPVQLAYNSTLPQGTILLAQPVTVSLLEDNNVF